MRIALKKGRDRYTDPQDQIRCGPYGKSKLRPLRRLPGNPTDAEIGRAMIDERKKWMNELKQNKYGGYDPQLQRIFGLQVLEEN